MLNQRAAYTALIEELAVLDLELMVGVPRAIQRLPAAYLSSTTITRPAGTFTLAQLRPTLSLLVNWQENNAAELQLVDFVDGVVNTIHNAKLASVCTCQVETVTYDWRTLGGIDYRSADLTLVLKSL